MKIRNGFVSNSSTSSFLIYGIVEYPYELEEKFKGKGIIQNKEYEDNYEWFEEIEKMFSEKNLNLDIEMIYDGEQISIGKSWDSIKDNQTGKEFKDEIEKSIKELLGEKYSSDTHEGAWRNG